jgi:hypothetical protein
MARRDMARHDEEADGMSDGTPATDFDGAGKAAIEAFLPDCLARLFPEEHALIHWPAGYTLLDAELQQLTPGAERGRRAADTLVQVRLRAGEETWILVHLEIQHQRDADFADRMFTSYARIRDRFKHRVTSLAILGDDAAAWRPDTLHEQVLRFVVECRFPTVKVLDYRSRWAELEASANLFAAVAMAHPRALETRGGANRRRQAKFALERRLDDLGDDRERILSLFRFTDWLMMLPAAAETAFRADVRRFGEERQMPHVTSTERMALNEGLSEGLREGLEEALLLKFGGAGRPLVEGLASVDAIDVPRAVKGRPRSAASLEDMRVLLRPGTESA